MIRDLLAAHRPLGRLARAPFKLLPKRLPLPILSGINRGYLWMVGAGIHACWLGTYEQEKLRYVASIVRPGMTVFDVGAHAGFYTLAFARLVGPQGKVIAFEPNPTNVANLKRHMQLNRVKNVEIIQAAVSDRVGTAFFALGDTADARDRHYMGALSESGFPVSRVRLDDYGEPSMIKMDIEGGEGPALLGAKQILARQEAHILIALHGISDEQCVQELRRHAYQVSYLSHDEIHAQPSMPDTRLTLG